MQDSVITDNSKEQKIMNAITKFKKAFEAIKLERAYDSTWAL
jgi:hypothetical protein